MVDKILYVVGKPLTYIWTRNVQCVW